MKRFVQGLLLILATQAGALELSPQPQQARAAALSAQLLGRFHYRAQPLDDVLSEKIFDRYLKSLDSEKYIFTQADINRFAAQRTQFDDALREGRLQSAFEMFNLYARRATERFTYARGLLKSGFDFTQNENFQISREKAAWAASEQEINELWRKRVKNDWLRLKLAGKDDAAIVATLDKRYEASIRRVDKLKGEDAFQIFMNAFTMSIDPHTNYLSPRASENFDITMRLSLVGIGAVLEEKDEYTVIRELVAGGPAVRSGQLKVGDRIVGVAQGENAPLVDVLGWRLDDTVRLIRGETDTTVVLDILPADAGAAEKHKIVKLVRKKISLEEQAAKKTLLTVTENGVTSRIGVITLPSFYMDFEARQKGERNFKSATRDVERILGELKKQKVDSVLIDLRGNGGGSLIEAIELTGLFIDKGPVVQQRDAAGKISVENDTHAGTAWNGPLGVLIDHSSASASEIFAAAIQDYGRGLIFGEASYGKGTVQTLVDLDRLSRNNKEEYGELKMTIAQFFRIDGGTTQLRGVTPDIAFPTEGDAENQRESAFDNALPWTSIAAADYVPANRLRETLPVLRERHEARIGKNPEFAALSKEVAEFARLRERNTMSLNENERRKERDALDALSTARDNFRNGKRGKSPELRDDGLQSEERPLDKELALDKERKNARDPLLNEAAHILADNQALQKNPGRASNARSGKPATAAVQ